MTSPWDLHPYQFVRQNPILYDDPDGNRIRRPEEVKQAAATATEARTALRLAGATIAEANLAAEAVVDSYGFNRHERGFAFSLARLHSVSIDGNHPYDHGGWGDRLRQSAKGGLIVYALISTPTAILTMVDDIIDEGIRYALVTETGGEIFSWLAPIAAEEHARAARSPARQAALDRLNEMGRAGPPRSIPRVVFDTSVEGFRHLRDSENKTATGTTYSTSVQQLHN